MLSCKTGYFMVYSHKIAMGVNRMKRVTIRDVAKAAGVSITTVSKALNNYPDVNEKTKRRIQELVQKMDYVPDAAGRSMGGISEPVVGVLINDLRPRDPSGAVYGILSGVCRACREDGVEFLLLTTDPDAQRQTPLKRLCLRKQLSGLVCSGFRLTDPYIEQINGIDIPCACIDIVTGNPRVMEVSVDNVRAADEAVSLLINSGRRQIAIVHGAENADVSNRRIRGYCAAMERSGLPVLPARMINGEFEETVARSRALRLLEADREIDAFFCASDQMALGVCQAIEERGLSIGRDIAVVGFDDIPTAQYLYGGLTTIRQDFFAMGHAAGYLVCGKVLGLARPAPAEELLYELVVRASAQGGKGV